MNNHKRELRRNIVESLALAMQDRGTDSTGVACLFGDGSSKIYKDTEKAEKFIETPKFEKIIESNPVELIGHTRLATVGEVNRKNAHPFRRGQIIGAHNGGVENYLEVNKGVAVDSEVIFALLKKHKNDYKKAFAKISGNFAISWTNIGEKHSLYLVRDGNPLHWAIVPSLKTMFWCSTAMPLHIILRATIGKNNFQLFEVEEKKVYFFDEFLQHRKYKVFFKERDYSCVSYYDGRRYYYDDDYNWNGVESRYKKKWRKKQGKIELLTHPAESGHIKEEELDDDEIGYEDLGYSNNGKLFVGEDAAQDLARRGLEDGCAICKVQVAGEMWYDTYKDELYCAQCANDVLSVDGAGEQYQMERIDFVEREMEKGAKEEEKKKSGNWLKTFVG